MRCGQTGSKGWCQEVTSSPPMGPFTCQCPAGPLGSDSQGQPSGVKEEMKSESESHSVMSDSLLLRGLYSPWNSSGQNTGVGSLSLLQGIFPNQGSNPGLPHCKQILYQLCHIKKYWYLPCIVQYVPEPSLHPTLCTSLSPTLILSLQPLENTSLLSVRVLFLYYIH